MAEARTTTGVCARGLHVYCTGNVVSTLRNGRIRRTACSCDCPHAGRDHGRYAKPVTEKPAVSTHLGGSHFAFTEEAMNS